MNLKVKKLLRRYAIATGTPTEVVRRQWLDLPKAKRPQLREKMKETIAKKKEQRSASAR